jgi:hypothetical protein
VGAARDDGDRGARAGGGNPRPADRGSPAVARDDPAAEPNVDVPGRGIATCPAERIAVSRPAA